MTATRIRSPARAFDLASGAAIAGEALTGTVTRGVLPAYAIVRAYRTSGPPWALNRAVAPSKAVEAHADRRRRKLDAAAVIAARLNRGARAAKLACVSAEACLADALSIPNLARVAEALAAAHQPTLIDGASAVALWPVVCSRLTEELIAVASIEIARRSTVVYITVAGTVKAFSICAANGA